MNIPRFPRGRRLVILRCNVLVLASPHLAKPTSHPSALRNASNGILPRRLRRWCLRRISACAMVSTRTSPCTPSKTRGTNGAPTQQQPFKTKPLEHMDLMERVYAGAAATGKHAGMGPLSSGMPPHGMPDRVSENVMDCLLFDDAPLHSTADGSANGKCRKQAAPGTVASSMDNLVDAVNYLARLMTVPGLQGGGPLFSFACSLMDSPDNCDLIMGLPLDYIVNWLKEKRVITHQPVVVEWSRGARLFGQDGVIDMD
ncbi:hypothetical protein CsSME_00029083 [Camellia sinensis var. sinensis]